MKKKQENVPKRFHKNVGNTISFLPGTPGAVTRASVNASGF